MANEHVTRHGNPWRTVEHAREWIARLDREPRDRSEELRTLVSLLPFERSAAIQVLELGAGHGVLTTQVLDAFPLARVLALDLQPVMIEEGRRRLAGYGERIRYRQWDLEQPDWAADADGPFDAAISSLAIHHLQRQRKAALAHQVFARLRPGGVFLNLDYVTPASDNLVQRYKHAEESTNGHHPHSHGGHSQNLGSDHAMDSLFDQLDDLRTAGFLDVDVFWKRLGLALFGGTRAT
jgi:tRNA (cmo5U34)-methyltransferase